MDQEFEPLDRQDLLLVDRLWRSGTSAVATSPGSHDDALLLQRLLSHDDHGALRPLLRRHRVATWRLAATVTLDVERAETAVELAWREVLAGSRETPEIPWANPRAWLFDVTRRHAIEAGAAPGVVLDLDADISKFPFDQTGDIGLLAASLSLLDEVARTAVWLHTVEGFDDVDIASVLHLNRLETHELIDGAMAELRVDAVTAQIAAAAESCRAPLRLSLGYLEETLSGDDESDLLAHLRQCRKCAARMDAVEAPGLSLVDRVLAPRPELTDRLRALLSATSQADV